MTDLITFAIKDDERNDHPQVIAFFTIDTPYQHEAELLKLSLESLQYNYSVFGMKSKGSWQKNTQMKASFIREMLDMYPGDPLLYLDVDSVMVKAPILLDDIDADVAAVHFIGRNNQPGNELLSGTLYLGGTERCRKMVRRWMQINEKYPETLPNGKEAWDQRTLAMAIQDTPDINFVELPQEYTWITELTQRRLPDLNPVIMHTRGAKRFKRLIDGQEGYAV